MSSADFNEEIFKDKVCIGAKSEFRDDEILENSGIDRTLIRFNNNLNKNKGNLLLFLEYHKYKMFLWTDMFFNGKYFFSRIESIAHEKGQKLDWQLYSELLIENIKPYVYRGDFTILKAEDGLNHLVFEIGDITYQDLFLKTNQDYDKVYAEIKSYGVDISTFMMSKKYGWYLMKSSMHNIPIECYPNAESCRNKIFLLYQSLNEKK